MTREELKKHCEKEIEMCEFWAIGKGEKPSGKVYEEHKLILELLEQETVSRESYEHEYFLRKEFEVKIAKLEHDKNDVLDKIRAEIESITPKAHIRTGKLSIDTELMIPLDRVLDVIDKYKAESEDKE